MYWFWAEETPQTPSPFHDETAPKRPPEAVTMDWSLRRRKVGRKGELHNSGPRHKQCHSKERSPSPGEIPMLSDLSLAGILFQKQPANLRRYPEDPEPTACAVRFLYLLVPSSTKTERWCKGQWDWKQLEGKNYPNLASHCGKPG